IPPRLHVSHFFSSQSYRPHPYLHSFPTRRSSDLNPICSIPDHWSAKNGAMLPWLSRICAPCWPRIRTMRSPLMPSATLWPTSRRSEEHTSELQSRENLVCRLLLEKKKKIKSHLST